jgi:hypothetical protein
LAVVARDLRGPDRHRHRIGGGYLAVIGYNYQSGPGIGIGMNHFSSDFLNIIDPIKDQGLKMRVICNSRPDNESRQTTRMRRWRCTIVWRST